MQRSHAVGEGAEQVFEEVCGRGAVDEDDCGFFDVLLG